MKRLLLFFAVLTLMSVTAFAQDKMMSAEPMMMASGLKVDFTTIDDAKKLAETGPTVLFFYAQWCPFCRKDVAEIDERLAEMGNVAVVVVNYDKETNLRRMYGVTYQHTFVQIDGSGEMISLWSGGGVDGILRNVAENTEMKGGMN